MEQYYEVRVETRKITREDDGTFVNAEDCNMIGEPILFSSEDRVKFFNFCKFLDENREC